MVMKLEKGVKDILVEFDLGEYRGDEFAFKGDDRFRYMLLSRMKSDCDYYLGNGNRYAGHLWAHDEKDQIRVMKALHESFSREDKPEWLTYSELLDYESKLCGGVEVFFTFGSSKQFPFEMGYITITAPSVNMAIEEFRRHYPDVNEGVINCADYYYWEGAKARIREHGNGAGCHRVIVVESKDLSVDERIASATQRSKSANNNEENKTDVEFEKE
jgi:hypothetical protein